MSLSLTGRSLEEGKEEAVAASYDESLYEDDDEYEQSYDEVDLRPIVVGYAFGPKKMSTMGVVMAEASKTKLSATRRWSSSQSKASNPVQDQNQKLRLTQAALSSYSDIAPHARFNPESVVGLNHDDLDKSEASKKAVAARQDTSANSPLCTPPRTLPEEHVVFTVDRGLMSANAGTDSMGIRNIVRFFQSSCSSVGDSMSTGTCTASSTAGSQRTASTSRPTSSSASSRQPHLYPARVSFVPLDMEVPLEEQHGGQIDVILHKLTEDILCLSQLSMENQQLQDLSKFDSTAELEEALQSSGLQVADTDVSALRRVHRLLQFQKKHPNCYLVDDPVCVQTLMSRYDIATTLETCLDNVTSTSGIPVSSPRSTPLLHNSSNIANAISFPIIAKPLIAAGTKASHAMAVVLDPHSLQHVTPPSLCQEYCNHDAMLYKVYVLGDHVSVYKRRSLPNLPRNTRASGYLEFDSQRPYPRLSDFGFEDDECTNKIRKETTRKVTAEEVKPIVEALKEAFGLELFGFDVLITSTNDSEDEQRMLVVDVNYFPSYKEVPHFPALLARYLIDHAIESRRQPAS